MSSGGLRQAQGLCRAGRGGRAGLCGDLPGARRQPPRCRDRLVPLRRRHRRHQRDDVLHAGRLRRLRRVEDRHPLRGRQLLDPLLHPQVWSGHRWRDGRGHHRRLRICGKGTHAVPRRAARHQAGSRWCSRGAGRGGRRGDVLLPPHRHRAPQPRGGVERVSYPPGSRGDAGAGRRGTGCGPARRRPQPAPDPQRCPVITLFEREGPGGTEIGSKVAQALGVGFTGQRFSSREISQLDDDVVTPNGFDRFVRSLSCPARRSPHWPRPWRSPWTTVWQTRPLERCWKPSATVAS